MSLFVVCTDKYDIPASRYPPSCLPPLFKTWPPANNNNINVSRGGLSANQVRGFVSKSSVLHSTELKRVPIWVIVIRREEDSLGELASFPKYHLLLIRYVCKLQNVTIANSIVNELKCYTFNK